MKLTDEEKVEAFTGPDGREYFRLAERVPAADLAKRLDQGDEAGAKSPQNHALKVPVAQNNISQA